ncbi:MAG TPA: hypothetical protein ENI98_04975 [Gammaproteobacteria bacterium]|nr:hypothetical protein [Gammaproteobacteria bacterium]
MFAINHAATALIIKKRFPGVPLVWLLITVQFVEILWVLLNFLDIEHTWTESDINTVADIHLSYMPYSHSLMSSIVFAVMAWLIVYNFYKYRIAAIAAAIGIFSHIVLDMLTHTQDISLFPFLLEQKIGVGLYAIPMAAFFVEMAYGVFCWWVFRGSKALLATILTFNLANISFFLAVVKGPEVLMANHPYWIVGAVAVQIVVTLALIWLLAKPRSVVLEQQVALQRIRA